MVVVWNQTFLCQVYIPFLSLDWLLPLTTPCGFHRKPPVFPPTAGIYPSLPPERERLPETRFYFASF